MKQTSFALVLLFLFHQQLSSQSFYFSEDDWEYSGFSERKCVNIIIMLDDDLKTKLSEDRIKRSVESLCYNILPDDMVYGGPYSEKCSDYYEEQLNTKKITFDEYMKLSRNWDVIVEIDGRLLRTDNFYGHISAEISVDGVEDKYIKYRHTQKKKNERMEKILANATENDTITREGMKVQWNEIFSNWTAANFHDVVIFTSGSIYTGYKPYDLLPVINRHVTNVLEELNVAIRKYP